MQRTPSLPEEPDRLGARSLTSAVFASLKAEILACTLAPDEKLHIGNLAKRFNVSIAAVREALSRLVADGLVVARDQQGFRVSPASIGDLSDLTQTRIEIECLALRRAIERGGADWADQVESAWRAMLDHRPGDDEWPALHERFHVTLISACGLDWLMRFRSVLFEQTERYRALSRTRATPTRDIHVEHHAIVEATLARDADKATELLTAHFARTRDLAIKNYTNHGDTSR